MAQYPMAQWRPCVTAFLRPDNRWFCYFDSCRADAYRPLVAAVVGNVASDLYANADEADPEAAARFIDLGFAPSRREGIYLIPTDPVRTGLADIAVPEDTVIFSAATADEEDLRLLDDALKQDVPGNDGWVWDPGDFHTETFCDDFDPATYLVVGDTTGGGYIGLARVWIGRGTPRLGLIAVLPPYRRRGVARALLARAFAVLHERGEGEVTAEIDDTNTASLTLLGGMAPAAIADHRVQARKLALAHGTVEDPMYARLRQRRCPVVAAGAATLGLCRCCRHPQQPSNDSNGTTLLLRGQG